MLGTDFSTMGFGSSGMGGIPMPGDYSAKKKREERLSDILNELAPVPEFEGETRQNVLNWVADEGLGAVGAFGNLLDTFGAGVRNKLGGQSPFSHLSKPMSGRNKVSGRDLTTQWGWTSPNKETGFFSDWSEFGQDALGLGVEIATDPLTYFTGGSLPLLKGIGGLARSGRAIQKLGLLDEAADLATRKFGRRIGKHEARHLLKPQDFIDELDMLKHKFPEAADQLSNIPRGLRNQRLGGGMNIDIPFIGPVGPSLSPTFGYASKALDKANFLVEKSYPGRMFNKMFDWSARNWGGAAEQAIARRLTRYADNKRNYAANSLHTYYDTFQESQKAFRESFGDDIARRQAGQAPVGRFKVGDVVDHASLPGQARVIGSDQGELLVSVMDQEANLMRTHRIDPSKATRIGRAGSKVGQAHKEMLINKAHDSVMRLATELHGSQATGLSRGFKEFQMGDVVEEFGSQGLDISRLPAARSSKLHDTFNESIEALEGLVQHNYDDVVNKGLRIGEIKETTSPFSSKPEGIRHVPRYANRQARDRMDQAGPRKTSALENPMEEVRNARDFGSQTGTSKGRTAATSRVPTTMLNRMYRDKAIADMASVDDVANYIRQHPEYSRHLIEGWNPNAASAADSLTEHAKELAENVLRHRGDSVYSAKMLDDLMKQNDELTRSSATLDAVHETLAQDIKLSGQAAAQPGGVPLHEVMYRSGMNVSNQGGVYSGTALEHLADVMGRGKSAAELDQLAKTNITPEVARAIQATKVIRTKSEELSAFLKAWDSFTNLFKSNVTLPFASFFMRNGMSGQFVNLTSGDIVNPADIARYTMAFKQAEKLAKGSARDQALLREIHSLNFVGGQTHFDDVAAIGKHIDPKDIFNPAPGSRAAALPFQLVNPFSKIWKGARAEAREHVRSNPSMYRGLFGMEQVPGSTPGMFSRVLKPGREIHRAWLGKGSRINASVEWMNRVPMYLYLRNKGYTQSAAARRVRELQFDYSELSQAEKAVSRRLVPFYTFQRKMGPLFFRTIFERPGGALAQFIKQSARATEGGETILPEYVTQNLAIPLSLGAGAGGGWAGLTGFGLAHENPMSFMQDLAALGRGDVAEFARGAFRHGMSSTNPLFKVPLEVLQDSSYFQKGPGGRGRRLRDMDPLLGRTISNVAASFDHWNWVDSPGGLRREPYDWGGELGGLVGMRDFGSRLGMLGEAAIAGSPISRGLSFTKGAFDPRPEKTGMMKLLNAMTGIKATALSERQLEAVGRDTMSEIMGSTPYGREFSSPYVDRKTLLRMKAEGKISERDFNLFLGGQSYYNHLREKNKAGTDPEKLSEMREIRRKLRTSI